MSQIAHQGPSTEGRNPLTLLPADYIEPATWFYGFYSDILRGKLGLVTQLRWWIKEYGLTPDECRVVMRRLMEPGQQAKFEHGGKMLAALGDAVAAIVSRRRARESTEAFRANSATEKQQAAGAEVVRQALAGFGGH